MYYPSIGRFLQRDPLALSGFGLGGWNRYSYVGNNPMTSSDATGLSPSQNKVLRDGDLCIDLWSQQRCIGLRVFPLGGGWIGASADPVKNLDPFGSNAEARTSAEIAGGTRGGSESIALSAFSRSTIEEAIASAGRARSPQSKRVREPSPRSFPMQPPRLRVSRQPRQLLKRLSGTCWKAQPTASMVARLLMCTTLRDKVSDSNLPRTSS